jgi:hypothetical protein
MNDSTAPAQELVAAYQRGSVAASDASAAAAAAAAVDDEAVPACIARAVRGRTQVVFLGTGSAIPSKLRNGARARHAFSLAIVDWISFLRFSERDLLEAAVWGFDSRLW